MGVNPSFTLPRSDNFPLGFNYFRADKVEPVPFYIHASSSIEFTLILEGAVEIAVNGKATVVTKGQIHTILPGENYTFRSLSDGATYFHIDFFPQLLESANPYFFQTGFVQPVMNRKLTAPRVFSPGDNGYDGIRKHFDNINLNTVDPTEFRCQLYAAAVGLCAAIMPYCSIIGAEDSPEKNNFDIVRSCLVYIQQHYPEKITLQEMADLVHLHPNYLCALFKETTGITIFEHLIRYRIRIAARRLRTNRLPINHIAEQCGFPNASFFARKFAEYHHLTPNAYRKKFAQNLVEEKQTQ